MTLVNILLQFLQQTTHLFMVNYIRQKIRQNFPGRKVTLVFGKDLIGRITDIKLAAVLKAIPIEIIYKNGEIHIYRKMCLQVFNQDQVSLHAFQETFGIRPRFRTGKPARSLTFLDQLKYDSER